MEKKLTLKNIICYGFLGFMFVAWVLIQLCDDETKSEDQDTPPTASSEQQRRLDLRNDMIKKGKRECGLLEFDAQGRIVGAFGYTLGDQFFGNVSGARDFKSDGLVVSVVPEKDKRVKWFDSYLLILTPITHRISQIVAGRTMLGPWHELDGDWERTCIKVLAQDWLFANGCKMRSVEESEGDRHLDGSCFAPSVKNEEIMMVFTWMSSEAQKYGVKAGVHFTHLKMTYEASQEYYKALDERERKRPDALEELMTGNQ